MKGTCTETLLHWVRICCSNWKFLHYPEELKSYDMDKYRKYRAETATYIMNHPIWIEYEKTFPKDVFLNKNRVELDKLFDEVTSVVYKILDSNDMVDSIKKDF